MIFSHLRCLLCLLKARLVCRQWRDVLTSAEAWSLPLELGHLEAFSDHDELRAPLRKTPGPAHSSGLYVSERTALETIARDVAWHPRPTAFLKLAMPHFSWHEASMYSQTPFGSAITLQRLRHLMAQPSMQGRIDVLLALPEGGPNRPVCTVEALGLHDARTVTVVTEAQRYRPKEEMPTEALPRENDDKRVHSTRRAIQWDGDPVGYRWFQSVSIHGDCRALRDRDAAAVKDALPLQLPEWLAQQVYAPPRE